MFSNTMFMLMTVPRAHLNSHKVGKSVWLFARVGNVRCYTILERYTVKYVRGMLSRIYCQNIVAGICYVATLLNETCRTS